MSGDPIGDACPGCGQPAEMQVGTTQSFCGTDDCRVIMWNPTMSLEELANDVGTIEIKPVGGEPA